MQRAFNPTAPIGQVPPKPTVISALRLAKAFRSYPRSERARDAAAWIQGGIVIHPTIRLAANVFAVSPAQVRAQLGPRAKRRPLSDAAVERLIARAGVERIWRVIERLTQPQLPLQAAE
jgi:hypothetical protein